MDVESLNGLNAFSDFGQALVDVNLAALSKEELSLFFDPHVAYFILADFEVMRLKERFGKPACVFLNRFVVEQDGGSAQELIKMEFEQVLFAFAKFQT